MLWHLFLIEDSVGLDWILSVLPAVGEDKHRMSTEKHTMKLICLAKMDFRARCLNVPS